MQDQPVTGGTLTKAALVELVADVGDFTKNRAEVIVETVFGTIAESLRRGAAGHVVPHPLTGPPLFPI